MDKGARVFLWACHKGPERVGEAAMAARRKRKRKQRPAGPPPQWSDRIYIRLDRKDVGLFKFLLEGHDNLAYMTFVDRFASVVQLIHSPESREEVLSFLESVQEELSLAVLELNPPRPGQSASHR